MIPLANALMSMKIDQRYIQEFHIPGILLMEEAAMAVCRVISDDFPTPCKVICIAGKGNNGGDALAIARILLTWGYQVKVGIVSDMFSGDAAINFEYFLQTKQVTLLTEENMDTFFSFPAEILIDGLLGTGLHRKPQGLYEEIIRRINLHPSFCYAVDLPSGVFADTGHADIAVQADKTITFFCPKLGHVLYPGKSYTGKLQVFPLAPLGDIFCLQDFSEFLVDHFSLPKRKENTNKGSYGKVAILAGSKEMSGAAILCTKAAIAGGAGLTFFLGTSRICHLIQQLIPVAIAKEVSEYENFLSHQDICSFFSSFNSIVLGPGLGKNKLSYQLVTDTASSDIPKVLDADALNILSDIKVNYGENTIITPHPGEFSRLIGVSIDKILEFPLSYAKDYARKYHVVVLLKGTTSIITDGKTSYFVTAGTPGMAKGGSGDVLSGVIGAFLAQGFSALESAYGAAYLCGKAAEIASEKYSTYAMTPEDTILCLGKAILQESE